ncbi:hypothetical protein TRFO_18821 [Tritrichomonas foetus]|uniref:Uncharacterized protein n=1 Tax=Tritrichomonas foetus TaxID=1144522 RepID=A0A1J4KPV2_9EUKA|nr:hypothetical protein TRFO_18821 [Tritrichomonas foetus]|eukprot:OHT11734.1 hypothetical protein TRFO_18821 [Tritrichomonas foetus]
MCQTGLSEEDSQLFIAIIIHKSNFNVMEFTTEDEIHIMNLIKKYAYSKEKLTDSTIDEIINEIEFYESMNRINSSSLSQKSFFIDVSCYVK